MSSTVIHLHLRENYHFPQICPATGLPIETMYLLKATPENAKDLPAYWCGHGPTVAVAVSSRADHGWSWSPLARGLGNMLLASSVTAAIIWLNLDLWPAALAIAAIFGPPFFWQLHHPVPLRIRWHDEYLAMEFKNMEYAEQFAKLNEALIVGGPEPADDTADNADASFSLTCDLSPFLMKWLGLPLAFWIIHYGLVSVVTQTFELKGGNCQGFPAVIGGLLFFVGGNLMVSRRCSPGTSWHMYEYFLSLIVVGMFLLLAILMILRVWHLYVG